MALTLIPRLTVCIFNGQLGVGGGGGKGRVSRLLLLRLLPELASGRPSRHAAP
jgi:hypothetical protein